MARQLDGRETWHRLLDWDKGQSPSERLSAQILTSEKYESVDPSHPLGGRDGLKDIICRKSGKKIIAACYFPRGPHSFSEIEKKFNDDIEGVKKNEADGIAFVTNQELRLSERESLFASVEEGKSLDLFHLERISAILNSPINYGTRLEFLDIEMTKEEQLSYMAAKDQAIYELVNYIKQVRPQSQDAKIESVPPVTVNTEKEVINSTFLPYDDPYHRCSHCGYGFKIAGRGLGKYAMQGVTYSGYITIEYATCPKCGSIDRV